MPLGLQQIPLVGPRVVAAAPRVRVPPVIDFAAAMVALTLALGVGSVAVVPLQSGATRPSEPVRMYASLT